MKAAMERLLVDCNFKSHELLMESLTSKAIQNNPLDADGWDKIYLNEVLMEFIDEEAGGYAAKVAAGGLARWSEEHKMLTNWAAGSVYTMAYGTMVYGHIKAAGARVKQEKQDKNKAGGGGDTKKGVREIRLLMMFSVMLLLGERQRGKLISGKKKEVTLKLKMILTH